MTDDKKTYKTDNLALFGFLVLNGLRYIDKEVILSNNGNIKIYFVFEDEDEAGRKLSLEFNQSKFKQYRDLTLFARTEIEKEKKNYNKRNKG